MSDSPSDVPDNWDHIFSICRVFESSSSQAPELGNIFVPDFKKNFLSNTGLTEPLSG